MLSYEAPFLRLAVTCSKGTYIRVLGEDIGRALGCGAHLQALRRTGVGGLTLDGAVTLQSFGELAEAERASSLAPVDALLSTFPAVHLPEAVAARFCNGQRIALAKEGVTLPAEEGRVRVYHADDKRLLGTALMREYGVLAPERLVVL